MQSVQHLVNTLLGLVIQVGRFLMSAIITVEVWVRNALAHAGLPPLVQVVLMLAIALLLIVGALRLFGGLIRIAVVLLLALIVIHLLLPVLPA